MVFILVFIEQCSLSSWHCQLIPGRIAAWLGVKFCCFFAWSAISDCTKWAHGDYDSSITEWSLLVMNRQTIVWLMGSDSGSWSMINLCKSGIKSGLACAAQWKDEVADNLTFNIWICWKFSLLEPLTQRPSKNEVLSLNPANQQIHLQVPINADRFRPFGVH